MRPFYQGVPGRATAKRAGPRCAEGNRKEGAGEVWFGLKAYSLRVLLCPPQHPPLHLQMHKSVSSAA